MKGMALQVGSSGSALTLAILLSVVPAAAQEAREVPWTASDLAGTWSSGGCRPTVMAETGETVHLARDYTWSETNFVVRYAFFEADCATPAFSFVATGPYELGAPRPDLGPVREAIVFIDGMYYEAHSEAGAASLGECGARIGVGRLTEVTETGCGAFPAQSECLGDFELFRVENGTFYPGLRTPDMCSVEGRPAETQTTGAGRVAR